MSEYWKSTPKYWCKHCKTFVRDTKLEKANHEATPKHQGNLKRFLRDLYRGHEKDEKDKERAKSEVARLNGLVAGSGSAASSSSSEFGRGPTLSIPRPPATEAQRKQQLSQLAEMGISIPDELRPNMAMAGEWQVTSERIIELEDGEKRPDAVALGVRKRVLDEEEQALAEAKKRRWGSAIRSQPIEEDDTDLDALLNNAIHRKNEPATKTEPADQIKGEVKEESTLQEGNAAEVVKNEEPARPWLTVVKSESSNSNEHLAETISAAEANVKQEGEEQAAPGVVFKKRKTKNIRHRP